MTHRFGGEEWSAGVPADPTWLHGWRIAGAARTMRRTLAGGTRMKCGMIKTGIALNVLLAVCLTLATYPAATFGAEPTTSPAAAPATGTVRIAAAQPRARLIDWHVKDVDAVLARVDRSLTELEALL